MGGKASLILVLGFSFTLGYISLNLNKLASRANRNMATYNEVTMSHNVAQAGANLGLSVVYTDPTVRGLIADQTLMNGAFDKSRLVVRMDSLNPMTLRLRSVSSHLSTSGRTIGDTVEVFFSPQRNNSFTLLFWMTMFEGNVFWITGDSVWGRVHSNGNLHMAGSPVFFEKVTTAGRIDPTPGTRTNNAIFKNGYETGVADIGWPTDLSELVAASTSSGRKYANEIWVELDGGTSANNDGWAYIYNSSAMTPGTAIDSVELSDPTFNGVILSDRNVHVKGTLDGKLSITSLSDIRIEDDILYENRDFANSDDILGLIAEDNAFVVDNVPNRSDCYIDGSVFVRDGSFQAENYNLGAPRGQLHFNGSIVQEQRGPVGTFSGSTLRTGYLKKYRYDPRLADPMNRPPFYPGYWNGTLAITNWWESIRIPDFDY